MTHLLLLAQLAAPYCGYNYGVEITPQDAFVTGCYVPSWSGQESEARRGQGGAVLREDPLSPGGVRATPVLPAPLPQLTY
jgi:hypothetical protein